MKRPGSLARLVVLILFGWLVLAISRFLTDFARAGSFRSAFEQWLLDLMTKEEAVIWALSAIVVMTGVWLLERWLARKQRRPKETGKV